MCYMTKEALNISIIYGIKHTITLVAPVPQYVGGSLMFCQKDIRRVEQKTLLPERDLTQLINSKAVS